MKKTIIILTSLCLVGCATPLFCMKKLLLGLNKKKVFKKSQKKRISNEIELLDLRGKRRERRTIGGKVFFEQKKAKKGVQKKVNLIKAKDGTFDIVIDTDAHKAKLVDGDSNTIYAVRLEKKEIKDLYIRKNRFFIIRYGDCSIEIFDLEKKTKYKGSLRKKEVENVGIKQDSEEEGAIYFIVKYGDEINIHALECPHEKRLAEFEGYKYKELPRFWRVKLKQKGVKELKVKGRRLYVRYWNDEVSFILLTCWVGKDGNIQHGSLFPQLQKKVIRVKITGNNGVLMRYDDNEADIFYELWDVKKCIVKLQPKRVKRFYWEGHSEKRYLIVEYEDAQAHVFDLKNPDKIYTVQLKQKEEWPWRWEIVHNSYFFMQYAQDPVWDIFELETGDKYTTMELSEYAHIWECSELILIQEDNKMSVYDMHLEKKYEFQLPKDYKHFGIGNRHVITISDTMHVYIVYVGQDAKKEYMLQLQKEVADYGIRDNRWFEVKYKDGTEGSFDLIKHIQGLSLAFPENVSSCNTVKYSVFHLVKE